MRKRVWWDFFINSHYDVKQDKNEDIMKNNEYKPVEIKLLSCTYDTTYLTLKFALTCKKASSIWKRSKSFFLSTVSSTSVCLNSNKCLIWDYSSHCEFWKFEKYFKYLLYQNYVFHTSSSKICTCLSFLHQKFRNKGDYCSDNYFTFLHLLQKTFVIGTKQLNWSNLI